MITISRSERFHQPARAVYEVAEDGGDIVVRCQYFQVRHARAAGWNIADVRFRHGSGKSIFAAPCVTSLQRGDPYGNAPYGNCQPGAEIVVGRRNGNPHLAVTSALINRHGLTLSATCTHSFEYLPWGLVRQQVVIDLHEEIPDAWNVTIARPVVASHLNEFTTRPGWDGARTWQRDCRNAPWVELRGGDSFRDCLAAEAGEVPLYLQFLQRGVEGFDWCCGEDLEQWCRRLSPLPHVGKFRVRHAPAHDGWEVTLSPLDSWPDGMPLRGRYAFDFHMGLPFVHERVRPYICGGDGLHLGQGAERRFPAREEIADLAARGVSLLRLHDDGPQPGGVFWRDGSYPPYPPATMAAMDACLADLGANGIACTPYFSLHEISPETPGAEGIVAACKRTVDAAGTPLVNRGPTGIWGTQLCLLSDWRGILQRNIDTVLARHAFAGVYFDWTMAMPCGNAAHRGHLHWDIDGFVELLEWTRERIGPQGILYLHMSCEPFIMAANLATCVLMNEHGVPERPGPDLLPPNGQSVPICSQLALWERRDPPDARRIAIHCLLNNVAAMPQQTALLPALGRLPALSRYRRFLGEGASPVRCGGGGGSASAVWWGDDEALVVVANLGGAPALFRASLAAAAIGWDGGMLEAELTIAPLEFSWAVFRRGGAP